MSEKKAFSAFLIIILIGMVMVFYTRSLTKTEPFQKQAILLDTYVTITVYPPYNQKAKKAVDLAFKKMRQIDFLLNRYDSKSEVSKINQNAGSQAVQVSKDTFNVISLSLKYARLTQGAFDISVGALVSLWDFNKRQIPSKQNVRKNLTLVDFNKVILNPNQRSVRLSQKGVILDLGGVAKGYAVDKAISTLRKFGVKNAIVSTGSTTAALGSKPNNAPFKIGIRHPRKANDIVATLKLENKNISTSGDYQQYFIKSGRRYNHIIDPKTGWPAKKIMSLTVITSNSAAVSDILSTSFFVMGLNKTLSFIKTDKKTEIIAVTSDKQIVVSSGAKKYLQDLKSKL